MMTKVGSTQIVIFMIPGVGIPIQGRGHVHVSRIVKCICFLKYSSLL